MRKNILPIVAVMVAVLFTASPAFGQGVSINVDNVKPVSTSQFVDAQVVDVENNTDSDLVMIVKADVPAFVKVKRKAGGKGLLQLDWTLLGPNEKIELELFKNSFPSQFEVFYHFLNREGKISYTVSAK